MWGIASKRHLLQIWIWADIGEEPCLGLAWYEKGIPGCLVEVVPPHGGNHVFRSDITWFVSTRCGGVGIKFPAPVYEISNITIIHTTP